MTLLAFAFSWYAALVVLAVATLLNERRRRQAAQAPGLHESYEDHRRRERAAHLARVREEELAELRRRERHGGAMRAA